MEFFPLVFLVREPFFASSGFQDFHGFLPLSWCSPCYRQVGAGGDDRLHHGRARRARAHPPPHRAGPQGRRGAGRGGAGRRGAGRGGEGRGGAGPGGVGQGGAGAGHVVRHEPARSQW